MPYDASNETEASHRQSLEDAAVKAANALSAIVEEAVHSAIGSASANFLEAVWPFVANVIHDAAYVRSILPERGRPASSTYHVITAWLLKGTRFSPSLKSQLGNALEAYGEGIASGSIPSDVRIERWFTTPDEDDHYGLRKVAKLRAQRQRPFEVEPLVPSAQESNEVVRTDFPMNAEMDKLASDGELFLLPMPGPAKLPSLGKLAACPSLRMVIDQFKGRTVLLEVRIDGSGDCELLRVMASQALP